MTAPTVAYTLPAAHTAPPAHLASPGGHPAPAGPPPPRPPAGRPFLGDFPGNAARQLRVLLAERGVERVYHSSHGDLAVVSLPGVTVWIGPHHLSWPSAQPPGEWPPDDLPGAADHLAQLVESQTPAGVPWEGDVR